MLYSALYKFKPTSVISALIRQILINVAKNGYIEVREHISNEYEKTDIYELKVTSCIRHNCSSSQVFSVIVNRDRGRVSVSFDSCVEFAKISSLSALCIGGVKLTVGNGIKHAFLVDIAAYTKSVVYRLDSITGYELEPRYRSTVLYYTPNYITKLEPLLRKAKYEVVSEIEVPMLGVVKLFMLSPLDDPRTAVYLPAIPLRVELYTPHTHTLTSWVEYDASAYDRESSRPVFIPEMIKYNVVYTLVWLTNFGYVYRNIMNYKFENIQRRLEDLVELP